MLIVSISVYVVDTFTAINLLAFDRWAGQIKPEIPLTISRWIFAGCIILSFLLLFYRWMRAIKVMRKGGVAQSYLDPLAIRIQSIRRETPGDGSAFWSSQNLPKVRRAQITLLCLPIIPSKPGYVFASQKGHVKSSTPLHCTPLCDSTCCRKVSMLPRTDILRSFSFSSMLGS